MNIIADLKQQILDAKNKISEIQEQCSHPLVARITKNDGYSGHYDDPEGYYWTKHTCTLCEKSWTTEQNWKRIGDGMGFPKKT